MKIYIVIASIVTFNLSVIASSRLSVIADTVFVFDLSDIVIKKNRDGAHLYAIYYYISYHIVCLVHRFQICSITILL